MSRAQFLIAAAIVAAIPATAHGSQTMNRVVETVSGELDGGTGGVSVDAAGNIYVSDFGAVLSDRNTMGRKIFRVTPSGESAVFATGFEGASGSEFDGDGNLYQSNIRGGYVSRITPDGAKTEYVREGIAGPVGIAFDERGNLYVANCGNNTVQRVTPQGASTTFVADSLLQCPNGIDLDDAGNIYVANFNNGDVLKITPDGAISRLATMPGGNNGHLVHHDGVLYVVDRALHQIRRVTLTGESTLFAGSGERGRRDGAALEATFSFPNDLDVSPDGRWLYVNEIAADTGDHTQLAPMILRRIQIR